MDAQISWFNRILLTVMVLLYVLSMIAFSYANWMADPDHQLWMFLVNGIILSLPLVLFYGAAYVLISAWREHSLTGQVRPRLLRVMRWAPRAAAIVIILFITLFSLDVFEMDLSPLQLLGAFIIHSLPSIFMIVLLVFAWKRSLVGFIAYLAAGLFFLRFVIFGGGLANFLLFSGPLLLVSALFYADWRWSKPKSSPPLDAAA
jgi:hypothetical protein